MALDVVYCSHNTHLTLHRKGGQFYLHFVYLVVDVVGPQGWAILFRFLFSWGGGVSYFNKHYNHYSFDLASQRWTILFIFLFLGWGGDAIPCPPPPIKTPALQQ